MYPHSLINNSNPIEEQYSHHVLQTSLIGLQSKEINADD
jgi:mRNA-degrading endonuclease YafQ of YafQ-DinJ toxin-antitoxin module